MTGGGSSYNRDSTDDNVDGELELGELSDVVENSLTPLHGSMNRLELVVPDHKIGSVFGDIAARSHTETDLSALESLGIGDTFSSHTNNA